MEEREEGRGADRGGRGGGRGEHPCARYYEERNLLPAERTAGGQRHYTEAAVERVRLIQLLYAAGLSSRVIAELLPCVHTGVATAAQLELLTAERDRIDRQAAGLVEARDRLDGVIAAAAASAVDPGAACRAAPDVRDAGSGRCHAGPRSAPRRTHPGEGTRMPFVTVGTESSADIEIHYRDHGTGAPVVLIHGYPLDGNSWERQERALLAAGYRCISYDRRGFGLSSQPTTGYDYDTFAADLRALLDHLALDQDVVLAGFSMGSGEVTRYLGRYGSAGVAKAALFGVIPPFLLRTDDNPQGLPGEVFEGIKAGIVEDRYAHFEQFFANFYNTDVLAPERISEAALRASFQVAVRSGPHATYACVDTWLTDFRADLPKIDVPTLVVHGTADRILPFEATAARLRDERLIADLTVVEVPDGPHNIGWTHPDEVNEAFLAFLAR